MIRNAIIAAGALALVAIATLGQAQTPTADDLYLCITSTMDETNAKSRYNAVDRDGKVRECARLLMARLKAAEATQTGGLTTAQRQQLEAARAAIGDVLGQAAPPTNPPPVEPPPPPPPVEPSPPPPPVEPPPATPPSLAEVAAIVAAMPPGTFQAISTNTIRDVRADCEAINVCAVQSIGGLGGWDGSAYDTQRNELFVWGGGHADYGGNEVYIFSMATRAWQRVTEPSPYRPRTGSDPARAEFEVADGTEAPVSAHSYDTLLYLPNLDRYLVIPQSSYLSGNAYDWRAYLFDRETKTWSRGPQAPYRSYESSAELLPDGRVVVSFTNGIQVYDPVAKTWTVLQRNDDSGNGSAGAYHPATGYFIQAGHYPDRKLVFYDMKLTNPERQKAPLFGNVDWFEERKTAGLAYRPKDGKIYIWAGSSNVWTVDPRVTPWRAEKYSAPSGPSLPGPHIWGKWQYVPALDVFVGWRSVSEPVWIYKPDDRPGDATDTTSKPVLQNLIDGATGSVTLPPGTFGQSILIAKPLTVTGSGTVLERHVYGDKAQIVVAADGVTLVNIEGRSATNNENAALVRLEQPNATLRNLVSRDNDTHIMSSGVVGGHLVIDGGAFTDARGSGVNPGQTHGFYLGWHDMVTARGFKVLRTHREGHSIKTRSLASLFENCTVSQVDGEGSRSFDFVVGGKHVIRKCTIEHGPNGNLDIIGFAHEHGNYPDKPLPTTHALTIEDSTIICRRPGGCDLATVKAGITVQICVRGSTLQGVRLKPEHDCGGNTVR